MAGASGKRLHDTYMLAWERGLKTTYYLRTMGATSAEKSTSDRIGQLNSVSVDGASSGNFSYATTQLGAAPIVANGIMASAVAAVVATEPAYADISSEEGVKFCALDDPECEACQ